MPKPNAKKQLFVIAEALQEVVFRYRELWETDPVVFRPENDLLQAYDKWRELLGHEE